MNEYTFTQQVDFPDLLMLSIQQSNIATPLVNIETIGSGPTMVVNINFNDILSSNDQITLNSLMSSYVNNLSAEQQHVNQMIKDMNFGLSLIQQFGAANRIAQLNTTQIIQISQELAPIQSLLLSGSITTALTAIQSITPNALLTQDVINGYIQTIQGYLGAQ